MSPSTMSITASPVTDTPRRPVVAGESNKINADPVNDEVITPVGGDRVSGGKSKDLKHYIRARKGLDSVKKKLPLDSTPYPRRTCKTATLAKPRWQTVGSVLVKNFLLLLVLVGLVQMVRVSVIGTGSDGSVNLAGFSDMEGRIADVESFLKKTTAMLQVQLEAVDRKLDGEFSGLRGELNKKLEEKSEEIHFKLKTLDEKNEILEKALGQLTSKDLLSKEDFSRLYIEFKKSRDGDLGQTELSLDEIKELARQIVVKEIERHSADGLAMVDYALGTGGAMVVQHSEPYVVGKLGNWFSATNMQRKSVSNDAEKMLKPSFGEPGQCFPLKGKTGYVQIRLRAAIVPEAITLEHVAKSVAYDRTSAPKDCSVFGWLQGGQVAHGFVTEASVDRAKMLLLTEFTYDLEKTNAQTFNVFDSASSTVIDTIRFDFTSNHGSPSHTCIYRVRVHGHEPNLLSHLDLVHH